MACITVKEVRDILPAGVTLSDQAINFAIQSAACAMSRACDCVGTLSATCKAQIQILLAAHFAAASDPTLSVQSETDPCCGGSATYGFKLGAGIMGTPFGQLANTISGGCLAELDKQPARLFSIGAH